VCTVSDYSVVTQRMAVVV